MNTPREDLSTLINAYLDGTMAPEQRAEFERRVALESDLAHELDLQRRIDGRLRVLAAAPEAPHLSDIHTAREPLPLDSSASTARDHGRARRLLRIAAVLALCAVGAWAALNRPWQSWMGPSPSDIAANVSYNELVRSGLKPIWVCGSEEDFKKYTRDKLGVPFTITPKPGLELVGWTYAGGLLDSSAQVLMCRADGKPVIVVMGKKADDRRMHADPGSGVKLQRAEFADLVMYEVSESDQTQVLGRVRFAGCGQ